jgi:hypothetical protein
VGSVGAKDAYKVWLEWKADRRKAAMATCWRGPRWINLEKGYILWKERSRRLVEGSKNEIIEKEQRALEIR